MQCYFQWQESSKLEGQAGKVPCMHMGAVPQGEEMDQVYNTWPAELQENSGSKTKRETTCRYAQL